MNKIVKGTAVVLLIGASLMGCGGGGSSDTKTKDINISTYQEKAGDSYTWVSTMKMTYSNGEKHDGSYEHVENYTKVDAIPLKYNYSNTIIAPYLLETDKADGETEDLTYMSNSGDTIIEDNLEEYTSIDFAIQRGSNSVETFKIGDKFNFKERATLFSSKSSAEVGEKKTEMAFTILSQEKITVLAGKFDTIKIGYKISNASLVNGIDNAYQGEGYIWIDKDSGISIKIAMDVNMTLNQYDMTVTFLSESELKAYSISSTKNVKKLQKQTLIKKINLDKVFSDIQARVDNQRNSSF